jgi:hypothetical protein
MPWPLYLQGNVTLIKIVRFRASLDVVHGSISCPIAGIKTTVIPVYLRQLTANLLSITAIIEGICGSDIKRRKILNGQNFNPEVINLGGGGGSVQLTLHAVVQH